MDPALTAWAAGLFEGEGCMWKSPYSWYLKLTMTDKDVVEKFVQWAGYGNITIDDWNVSHNANHKLAYQWRVGKKSVVRKLVAAMLPHFGNRRAYKALNILDDLELTF